MESKGKAPPFLTSTLDGDEWSASRPSHFTLREIAPGTHWMEGWVSSRAGFHVMEKRKIPFLCRESKLDSSVAQPVAMIIVVELIVLCREGGVVLFRYRSWSVKC
jgi:hypothetical protein